MPEEQNVFAEQWNLRLNLFLGRVLSWKQLGESNNDIYCEDLKRKVGVDSIFGYKRNEQSPQQVVFVEVKTVAKLDSLSLSIIQNWVNVFQEKIIHAPHSHEFVNKYQPDANANYGLGLIGLWVRDPRKYSEEKIRSWLSQLNVSVRRQNPVNLFFASNQIISLMCTIYQTIKDLEKTENYISVKPYFPAYGDFPVADGNSLPIESLLSKFMFCKAKKRQFLKRDSTKQQYESYDAHVVFYTGKIENYDDLRFMGLALRHFQIMGSDIEIYTVKSPTNIRNEIKTFEQEFGSETDSQYKFNEITLSNDLPGWLA